MKSSKDLGKKNRRRLYVAGSAVWDQTEEALLADLLRNCLRWQEVEPLTAEHRTLLGPMFRQRPAAIHDRFLQALQTHFGEYAQTYRQRTQPESNYPTPHSSSWHEWLLNDLLGFRNHGGIRNVLSLASVFAVSTNSNTEKAVSDAHWIAVAQQFAERTQRATTDDLTARAQEICAALRAARGRKPGDPSPSAKNKAR